MFIKRLLSVRFILLATLCNPSLLHAESPAPPIILAITPKPESLNISGSGTPGREETIQLNSSQFLNSADIPVDSDIAGIAPDIALKNYYSPNLESRVDWSTMNLDSSPSTTEFNKSRRKLKMLFPMLTLGALNNYIFAGKAIDASGTSYAGVYDSMLVLGGSNHLADGMAELLNESGLDIISSKTASLIIILVPSASRAIYEDVTLNTKKLSFADALNHYAFKSASNQASHLVTQLALPYVRENIDSKKFPGLDKMLGTAATSAAMALPPLLFQIAYGLSNNGNIDAGKMVVDSSVAFMYSTAITSFKSLSQQAAHVYLDSAKDEPWCNPERQNCVKVDEDGVYSELIAGTICYIGAGLVDAAASMLPAPSSATEGMVQLLINNGLRFTPKILKTTSKHLRKVTAYAASDALKKKLKHRLAGYTSEAESYSNLLTFMTTFVASYASSFHKDGTPYRTGFGMKSVNAVQALGSIYITKAFYGSGLNHAFGFSEPQNIPPDYYAQPRGTSLIYPNSDDEAFGVSPVKIIHPGQLPFFEAGP